MLEKIKLYKIHVFEYSKREGTIAAKMENQISPEVKAKRSKQIIEFSNYIGEEIRNSYIGKEVNILVEEKEDKYYKGHTENYLLVGIKTKEDLKNKICKVKIEEIQEDILIGIVK